MIGYIPVPSPVAVGLQQEELLKANAMTDDQLAQAASAWVRGKKTQAALVELFIIIVKMGGQVESVMRHLGVWPDDEPGVMGGVPAENAGGPATSENGQMPPQE